MIFDQAVNNRSSCKKWSSCKEIRSSCKDLFDQAVKEIRSSCIFDQTVQNRSSCKDFWSSCKDFSIKLYRVFFWSGCKLFCFKSDRCGRVLLAWEPAHIQSLILQPARWWNQDKQDRPTSAWQWYRTIKLRLQCPMPWSWAPCPSKANTIWSIASLGSFEGLLRHRCTQPLGLLRHRCTQPLGLLRHSCTPLPRRRAGRRVTAMVRP